MPRKSTRLKKLEKELEEMELREKGAMWDEGYRPYYEEDMPLDYWRRKKELKEEIRKLKKEGVS